MIELISTRQEACKNVNARQFDNCMPKRWEFQVVSLEYLEGRARLKVEVFSICIVRSVSDGGLWL